MAHYSHRNAGFSLLELLIAVLVIGIGALGVLSMQSISLRGNNDAYLRTQAAFVAGDMVARMMANPDGVDQGGYDSIDSSTPPTDPSCISTGCNPLDLASQDAREWSQNFTNVLGANNFRAALPNATGTVTEDDGLFVVTISWTTVAEGGGENDSISIQARM